MAGIKSVQHSGNETEISKDLHENAFPSSSYDAVIPCKSNKQQRRRFTSAENTYDLREAIEARTGLISATFDIQIYGRPILQNLEGVFSRSFCGGQCIALSKASA